MKIALLGYGKMGKVIEKIALSRGHEIVLRKTRDISFDGLQRADVAIDFSIPEAAYTNVSTALNANIPVICGTTGWLKDLEMIHQQCQEKKGTFLYASNFSLGVNLFFELNKKLAQMMQPFGTYQVAMEEIHHTQKLDAPSGTAITLAEGIIENSHYEKWALDQEAEKTIPIQAKRIENVPGTHRIAYNSDVDSIEITHTAHSREGFALGAVIAAEWIADKKGVFTMRDVLGLNNI